MIAEPVQEKSAALDHEAEVGQRDGRAQPGQQGALRGEQHAGIVEAGPA